MTNKDLFDLLDKNFEGMTIEEKLLAIKKINNLYVEDYRTFISKELDVCPHCRRIFYKYLKLDIEEKIKTIKEYVQYGNKTGSEDKYLLNRYKYFSKRCPMCSKPIFQGKLFIETVDCNF